MWKGNLPPFSFWSKAAVTQYIGTLTWADQANANAPLAPYQLDASIDQNWSFTLGGTYHGQQIFAKGITIDNSGNSTQVTLVSGPWSAVVPQFTRDNVDLSQATQFVTISIADHVSKVNIQFYKIPTTDTIQNQFLISSTVQQTIASNFLGSMQPIINTGFTEWPQGISIVSGAAAKYTAEGWMIKAGNGTTTVSQQPLNGAMPAPFAARIQRNNGSADVTPIQFGSAVTSFDSTQFINQIVTVGFDINWGVGYSGANLTMQLVVGSGTDEGIFKPFTGQTIIFSQIITPSPGTRQRLSFTSSAVVPIAATQVGVIFLYTPQGVASVADFFDISRPQFDIGTTAQSFRSVPQALEKQRCQSFYEKLNGEAVANYFYGTGYMIGNIIGIIRLNYRRKRAIPSIVYSGSIIGQNAGGSLAVASFATGSISQDSVRSQPSFAAGFAAGQTLEMLDGGAGTSFVEINARM